MHLSEGHAGGIMTVGHGNVGLDQGQMRQDQTSIEAQMAVNLCQPGLSV